MKEFELGLLITGVVVGFIVLNFCRGRMRENYGKLTLPSLVSAASNKGLLFDLDSAQHLDRFSSVVGVGAVNPSTVAIIRNGERFIPAMGTIPVPLTAAMAFPNRTQSSFPDNWNEAAQYFSGCRNQQNCGSCWAFATTQILENRINFLTKGKWRDRALAAGDKTGGWLSPQYIISCVRDTNEKGCQGAGILEEVIRHLTEGHRNGQGLFLAKDYPYEEDKNGENNEGDTCHKPPGKPRFNFKDYYSVSDPNASKDESGLIENISRIKEELMTRGPVMTSMYVWDTFMEIDTSNNTPSSPYSTDEMGRNKMVGGHAVIIVGWGTVPGKDPTQYKNQYWILRNSWGPSWNHDGYWYWRMGDDLKGLQTGDDIVIEFQCVAGQPDMMNIDVSSSSVTSSIVSWFGSPWVYGSLIAVLGLVVIGGAWWYFTRNKVATGDLEYRSPHSTGPRAGFSTTGPAHASFSRAPSPLITNAPTQISSAPVFSHRFG
jgi:cathepsin B